MRALVLAGLVLAVPCGAQPPAPWMSGAQLLRKLQSPAEAQEAVAYLKAVHDMTADKEWCYRLSKPGTAQLQSELVDSLRALPGAQAKGSAAALAVRAWRAKWPCSSGCCHD